MQKTLALSFTLKNLFVPRGNRWLGRMILIFAFTIFDYVSTIVFCRAPSEEANVYARVFMESFGILAGLTLFVFVFNLPIYVTLSLDSHLVRLPLKIAGAVELFVDGIFAWNVAGLHFSGGSSWFWFAPDIARQSVGALLYLFIALLLFGLHYGRSASVSSTSA